ncbi:hypothetical protein [Ruegeria marina]|uniref:Uncharacterized protein n=1 Tax=Ruegeria marina TaxID=639004 RepID=A0A1G6TB99_9RHOB|nr:hypothetical protein [Ruegeria marina]SDD25747.1 hypothetical protein SAMN04488239_10643 [Ruegeria marina]
MNVRLMRPALVGLVALSTFGTSAIAQDETITVRVMNRTWAVTQVSQEPVVYRATRDWNNLNPYGPPARLRTHQAIAAVQQATGCTVDRNTLYQNISGQFFARVTCR